MRRLFTLIAVTLVLAGVVVVAANAQTPNVEGLVNQALNLVIMVLRAILNVIVDFIGMVLDEFVRAGRNLFSGK